MSCGRPLRELLLIKPHEWARWERRLLHGFKASKLHSPTRHLGAIMQPTIADQGTEKKEGEGTESMP